MGNYVIEDEVGEYSDYGNDSNNSYNNYNNEYNDDNNSYSPLNDPRRGYIIIAVTIIVSVIVLIFSLNNMPSNTFAKYEKELIKSAKEYVTNNSIVTNKEIYIDVSKLNIKVPSNCSLLSGVIYDGNDYSAYLMCNNYRSKLFDSNYDSEISSVNNFKLVGNDVVFLLKGMEYYELGYEGSNDVIISNNNDISNEGVYNIYYFSDTAGMYTRKVIVIDNPNLTNYFPTINTESEEISIIEVGQEYNDNPIAIDSIDGDITNKIVKITNINTLVPGEYRVLYNVQNSLGYATTIMKQVAVVEDASNEMTIMTNLDNEGITNSNIVVHVNVIGSSYSYTKLPNGTTSYENEFDYTIEENGQYEFVAVSKYEKEVSKVLKIDNIDKTSPTGTCVATLYSDKTNIDVTISSFNYVVGYDYHVNNTSSGYTSYNFYSSNVSNPKNVYVMIRDYVGNESKITCTKSEKQTFDPNGIRTVIRDKPRLHIPIETAFANKGYTVNDLNMCIYNRVKEAGVGTRWGVTAAAFGLIDCTYKMTGYVLPYNHTSGAVDVTSDTNYCKSNPDICGKLGVSRKWGTPGGSCTTDQCWHGMNCATFVRWAMCNGGMDLCTRGSRGAGSMISTQYFPEADGVVITGKSVKYYSGQRLTNYNADTLVRMLKPGDAIYSNEGGGHAFVVVGIDTNGIYTAEDGYYMRNIKYTTLTSGEKSYRLFFLDRYYENVKNRNNLYN